MKKIPTQQKRYIFKVKTLEEVNTFYSYGINKDDAYNNLIASLPTKTFDITFVNREDFDEKILKDAEPIFEEMGMIAKKKCVL